MASHLHESTPLTATEGGKAFGHLSAVYHRSDIADARPSSSSDRSVLYPGDRFLDMLDSRPAATADTAVLDSGDELLDILAAHHLASSATVVLDSGDELIRIVDPRPSTSEDTSVLDSGDGLLGIFDPHPSSSADARAGGKRTKNKAGKGKSPLVRTPNTTDMSAKSRSDLLRIRRQTKKRERVSEFRPRKKVRALINREFTQNRINSLVRIGANREAKKKYPLAKVRTILKVGCARGPTARADLSDVISMFGVNTDRWSVSLQRWRTFYG